MWSMASSSANSLPPAAPDSCAPLNSAYRRVSGRGRRGQPAVEFQPRETYSCRSFANIRNSHGVFLTATNTASSKQFPAVW